MDTMTVVGGVDFVCFGYSDVYDEERAGTQVFSAELMRPPRWMFCRSRARTYSVLRRSGSKGGIRSFSRVDNYSNIVSFLSLPPVLGNCNTGTWVVDVW